MAAEMKRLLLSFGRLDMRGKPKLPTADGRVPIHRFFEFARDARSSEVTSQNSAIRCLAAV
jgi:hypothetical protein